MYSVATAVWRRSAFRRVFTTSGTGVFLMLVLSRKPDESIRINDNITITLLGIHAGRVRLGINAPRDISILRPESQSRSTEDVEAGNVNRNAVTDWESEGGRVSSPPFAA